MTTFERYRCEDTRRAHRRVPVEFAVRCRRIGRPESEWQVEALDLSPGGIRLEGRHALCTGDPVLVTVEVAGDQLAFKGIVVGASPPSARRRAHVAFTGLSDAAQERLGRLLALNDAA